MRAGREWRDCERKLRRLNLPDPQPPHTPESWARQIGRRRGRPITINPIELSPEEAPGYTLRMGRADHIFVDRNLPIIASTHTKLHELAHVLLDHAGREVSNPESALDARVEREAELTAVVLASCLYRLRANERAAGQCQEHLHRDASASTGGAYIQSAIGASADITPWRPLLSTIGGWPRRSRIGWRLHHLWREVHHAIPALSIGRCPRLDVSPTSLLREPYHHWYQLVVGIQDAIRHLRPYMSAETHAAARHRARRAALDPWRVDAVGDATTLAVALSHFDAGTPTSAPISLMRYGLPDIGSEAARLARVAQELATSPYVAAELIRHGVPRFKQPAGEAI